MRTSTVQLPEPEPVPDEAKAERFPIAALLRPPMVGRVALFVGIWFVYYVGNYGWLNARVDAVHRQGL